MMVNLNANATGSFLAECTMTSLITGLLVLQGIANLPYAILNSLGTAFATSEEVACRVNEIGRDVLNLADGRRVTINVESVAASDEAVAAVGLPTVLVSLDGTSAPIRDSLLGAIWSPTRGTVGIPTPSGVLPLYPRIAAAPIGWHVIYFTGEPGVAPNTIIDPEIWYGLFNGRWEQIERIARYPGVTVYPAAAPDLAARGREMQFDLPYEATATDAPGHPRGLLEVRKTTGGRWQTDTIATPTTPSYVRVIPTLPGGFVSASVHAFIDRGGALRAPAVVFRGLQGASGPVVIADTAGPVRRAAIAMRDDAAAVAWTTYRSRNLVRYGMISAGGMRGRSTGHLTPAIRDGVEAVALTPHIVGWVGLDADSTARVWTYDGRTTTLIDSVVLRRPVFRAAVTRRGSGDVFLVAAEVARGVGLPAVEVVRLGVRCDSGR